MSSVLPPGRLTGYYSHNQQLYTVHNGSPDIVLHTPSPAEAPAIDSSTIIPRFREPRYLALNYAYLLFVPKRYPWHNTLFNCLNRPRHKLPIIKDGDDGFRLHPDVADEWYDLEQCLRALGMEMFRLAPQKHMKKVLNPWFFPARFNFLHAFRTEDAARFGAWCSIENFLPLMGFVSMGLWCMQTVETECVARKAEPPDWRAEVIRNTKLHPTFLDYVEESIIGAWDEERVGALYHIQSPADLSPLEREKRSEIEQILVTILGTQFPIPIYLSWGSLPQQISLFDVPDAFHPWVLSSRVLGDLASSRGALKFNQWVIDHRAGEWYREREPSTPPPPSSTAPPSSQETPRTAVAAPFPPLAAHSGQNQNETIQAFFVRRRESNTRTLAKDSPVDLQRYRSRAENAKRGVVPNKARVFVWENRDGHYIRQPITRGNFGDVWADYTGPQRRFDPVHNEWDLCELFENGDSVFGDGYANHPDDDSDDEMDFEHPTLPQDTDMAIQLPGEGNEVNLTQEERHPRDLEVASFENVPDAEDLGPNFTQSDLPRRDLAKSSANCVNLVYLKFGMATRTEEPECASIAGNLLDALQRRFGFVMPPAPNRFVAREPPKQYLKAQDLANVVGMTDIAEQLASQEGLRNLLCTFFGQCLEACSVSSIDKTLLDFHLSPSLQQQSSHFYIRREYLRSMRNPARVRFYYVLGLIRSGIGSQVLLFPRATDLVEVLRQGWGPDIKGIAGHLVARGIPFWLACISAEIMPAQNPVQSPKRGMKVDNTSGLGIRPHNYTFDRHDYNAYTIQREVRLLHTRRGRIALQYGGVMARLARSEIVDEDFFHEFDNDIYDVGDCLWDEKSEYAYWHDVLSDHEIDLLCGVYHVRTGQMKVVHKETQGHGQPEETETDQTGIISWWPKPNAWARGSLDGTWWTPQCEEFYQRRLTHFMQEVYIPTTPPKWRHNLKFRRDVKKCWDGYEVVADGIVQGLLAHSESQKPS